jgi:high-affinity iron transporter
VLETVAWVAYLVPVLTLFLLPGRTARATPAAAPAAEPTPHVTTETPEHVDARP